jgi:hypothetical protein
VFVTVIMKDLSCNVFLLDPIVVCQVIHHHSIGHIPYS